MSRKVNDAYCPDERFERLLYTVLLRDSEELKNEIESSDASSVTFSEDYYSRKDSLLDLRERKKLKYSMSRWLRGIAVAAMLIGSLLLLSMTSAPVREAFKNMFTELFGEFMNVGFVPDDPNVDNGGTEGSDNVDNGGGGDTADTPMLVINEYYIPAVAPEGVTTQSCSRIGYRGRVVYRADREVVCVFTQSLIAEKPEFQTDDYEITEVDINGHAGKLGVAADGLEIMLIWDDGRYSYDIKGGIDPETAVSMAKSLVETYSWPTVVLEHYVPAHYPDGATVTVERSGSNGINATFSFENGTSVFFSQRVFDSDLKIDSTNVTTSGAIVNGREATLILKAESEVVQLLWEDGRYSYYLVGELPPQTLISMAESLALYTDTE